MAVFFSDSTPLPAGPETETSRPDRASIAVILAILPICLISRYISDPLPDNYFSSFLASSTSIMGMPSRIG